MLFVKPVQLGQFPGGLPSVQDYGDFADTESFRSRSNYHYRAISTANVPDDGDGADTQTFYVAVFNTDNYLVVRFVPTDSALSSLFPPASSRA